MGLIVRFVSKIFIEAFTLTFLAEWGDRSQLTTIILAAREVRMLAISKRFSNVKLPFFQNVAGVTLGGTLGHAMCTGIAVLGGRIIAQRISVRTGMSFASIVWVGSCV